MPPPYSTDLRERVLLAYEHSEGTAAALARRFRVALNTVKNWVRAAESEGRRVAKPLGRGPDRVWARQSVRCCANWWRLTIMPPWPNIARGWRRRPGTRSAGRCSVSPSSAWAWHVKKDAPGERAGACRYRRRTRRPLFLAGEGFAVAVQSIAPETLVFLDETGISTKLTRLYACAPAGSAPTAPHPVTGAASPCSARWR